MGLVRGAGWASSFFGILTLAGACAAPLTGDETESGSASRIVGGQPTLDFEAVGSFALFGQQHCTGTLISPRRVVTAAHCFDGAPLQGLVFVLGPSFADATAVLPVASVTQHPAWDPRRLANDIAIADLGQDAPVAPMRILPSMGDDLVGELNTFVGYGVSDGFRGTGAGVKRVVDIEVVQVGATQFAYATPGRNTCGGDSGGPSFWTDPATGERLITGVTSYGDAACVRFGVNTRVDVYADFLSVPDPCGGETFAGRCDGNTVVWCEGGAVRQIDCGVERTCGIEAARAIANCLEQP